MSENDDDTVSRTMLPLTAAPDDSIAEALRDLYAQLPGHVVGGVEYHRIAATKGYLEHMQAIREILAPFGAFKDWCLAAGFNYAALHKALSRAYGDTLPDARSSHSNPPIDAASIGGLLWESSAASQAQAEYVRALEQKVLTYEARSPEEWAAEAEAARQRAAEDEQLQAIYRERFLREAPLADRAPESLSDEAQRAWEHLEGVWGAGAHRILSVARTLIWLQATQPMVGQDGQASAQLWLRVIVGRWLDESPKAPITAARLASASAYWLWLFEQVAAYDLGPPEEGQRLTDETDIIAVLTRERANAIWSHTIDALAASDDPISDEGDDEDHD